MDNKNKSEIEKKVEDNIGTENKMKKKTVYISIIAIISIVIVSSLIAISVKSQKNKSDEDNITQSENKDGNEVVTEDGVVSNDEWEPGNEPEPAVANGYKIEEFQTKIVELGYQKFDDESYDYFENDISLAFVQLEEDGVKVWINNKADISNEKIKSGLALLLPNTVDELVKIVEDGTLELTASLDNRSVSIKVEEDRLELFITK